MLKRKKRLSADARLTVVDGRPEPSPVDDAVGKSARDGGGDPLDSQASAWSPSTEAEPKDPNKHCSLCAASFNNPHMALQHYNGRRHRRNLSRRALLKGLEDHIRQGNLGLQVTSQGPGGPSFSAS